MSEPIDAEGVSIEHGGRMYHGRYYVKGGIVFCRYQGLLHTKSVELADAENIAKHLLREMVSSTKSET